MSRMEDTFVVITWPEVQKLFDIEGFDENSILIIDSPFYEEYGDSTYLVRQSFLKS